MKMEKLNKAILCILCMIFLVSLCGCKKGNSSGHIKSGSAHIALLLGYGYNDEEFIAKLSEQIEKKYGIETEEKAGIVNIFIYPKDFAAGGSSGRISKLADFVEEKKCKALITVGAPEFTNKALAKIKDSNPKVYVISLFSQDDILSTEGDSDIVLDFVDEEKPEGSNLDVVAESNLQHMDKIDGIIMKMMGAVVNSNRFTNTEEKMSKIIGDVLGSDWQVAAYLDSTTGLRSKNHFVLEYKGKLGDKKSILNKKKKQDVK